MNRFDVVIIGAGVIGCAIARELSRYQLSILLVDKNEDVGGDASRSNSAIIHTGYDAKPGTLEAKLVVGANPVYDQLTKELEVPFKRSGAILAAVNEEEFQSLPAIKQKSYQNGVYDLENLTPGQLKKIEPNISQGVKGGLFIPRESIIDPFLLTIALAENAVANGVKVSLSTKVIDLQLEKGRINKVITNQGEFFTRYVVNAAGLYCDQIAEMVGLCDFKEYPRKGQFYLLDKDVPYQLNHIILPVPTRLTKGKLVTPTIHGNLLLGPTAENTEDRNDKSVTKDGLAEILTDVQKRVPGVSAQHAIKQYAGLRPVREPEGYYIQTHAQVGGYLGLSGIRSTGLTASPTVAKYVVNMLEEAGLELINDQNFNPHRKGIKNLADMTWEEREKMINQNPNYGQIICRCESITEGEIIQAINRPLGAKSLDAVKRRVRAGMGRCQSGFCQPKVIAILARELGIPETRICKNEKGTEILVGKNR